MDLLFYRETNLYRLKAVVISIRRGSTLLQKYVQNDSRSASQMQVATPFSGTIFCCPAVKYITKATEYTELVSYGINQNIQMANSASNTLENNTRRCRFSSFKHASASVLNADSWYEYQLGKMTMGAVLNPLQRKLAQLSDSVSIPEESLRHNEGNVINLLWLDGHATQGSGKNIYLKDYENHFWTGR